MSKSEDKSDKTFTQTLPGIIAAIATLITAIGGCIAVVFGIPAISNAIFGGTPTPIISQAESSPTVNILTLVQASTQTPYPTYTPLPTFTSIPPTAYVSPVVIPTNPSPSPIGQWTVVGNGYTGVLNIVTIKGGVISGTIYDNPIEGAWNEFTQEITFKRINSPDSNVYQLWYGKQIKQGNEYILTGYFEDHNGSVGTYDWNAKR